MEWTKESEITLRNTTVHQYPDLARPWASSSTVGTPSRTNLVNRDCSMLENFWNAIFFITGGNYDETKTQIHVSACLKHFRSEISSARSIIARNTCKLKQTNCACFDWQKHRLTESFHSRDQQLCQFIGTIGRLYKGGRSAPIRKIVCDWLEKQKGLWHNNAPIPENNGSADKRRTMK